MVLPDNNTVLFDNTCTEEYNEVNLYSFNISGSLSDQDLVLYIKFIIQILKHLTLLSTGVHLMELQLV